jgi:dihydropyrimidinase
VARMIIQGGTVVSPEGTSRADVVIENGKVAGVVETTTPQPGDEVIDASGLLVMPGIVDAHTHIQLDTGIYKTADNWEIGTKTAAAGGTTTVIDFATQYPGQTVDEALDNRFKDCQPALIDYALHTMITDLPHGKEESMLGRLVERGAPSFKVYTTYRPNYYMDDATLRRLMIATREVGGLVLVHAENDSIVTDATQQLVARGQTAWRFHGQGRPALAESEAAHRVVYLASRLGAPIYVVHCTVEDSVRAVERARQEGAHAYCETCVQYLILDEDVYEGPHPERYMLQPPLRHSRDAGQPPQAGYLWKLAGEGNNAINAISTDSCDYTLAQKTEFGEFTKTPGGLPGLETLLTLVYTYGVHLGSGNFTLQTLVRKLCENPAKIFGLYPQKGTLLPGSDADVVLYDPNPEWTISHANLHYLAGYSPYEGMAAKGKVHTTISRGEIVYQNGEFKAKPGRGQFVKGQPFSTDLSIH